MPVILINLDRSTERLAHMRAEFERVGMRFERCRGVDGTDLPDSVKPYFCDAAGKIIAPLRPGEIGCYASHLAVWQRIAAGDYGPAVLVCEDDLILPDDLPDIITKVLAVAPTGWDIIRLSCEETKRPVAPVAPVGDGLALARFWHIPMLNGASLFSQAGAAKLVKRGKRNRPVDWDLAKPWRFGADSYGVIPSPVTQPPVPSETHDGPRPGPRQSRIFRFSTTKLERLLYNLRTMGLRQWVACLRANRRR